MLSNLSRWLNYALAILYTILGALPIFLPETLAHVFAWKVTPFMTMTIGGWALGNAWLAWISARRRQWNLVFSALLYLWLFGIGELLYLLTLLTNTLAALIGFLDWPRFRPSATSSGPTFTLFQNISVAAFIIFVRFLAIYGSTIRIGAPGTNGGIFPEVMSPFTLRSFGMFYLTLALAVVPFLWNENLRVILHHSIASYGLILFITIAGFVYLRLFDFAAKPGGLLYFIAYLAVGIPLIFVFRKLGTGTSN